MKILITVFLAFGLAASAAAQGATQVKFLQCGAADKAVMEAAISAVVANYAAFETFVENQADRNLRGCIKRRLTRDGKVDCKSIICTAKTAGKAIPGERRAIVCPAFFDLLATPEFSAYQSGPNKEAFLVGVLTHEWSHTCGRVEAGALGVGKATYDFYATIKPVTAGNPFQGVATGNLVSNLVCGSAK